MKTDRLHSIPQPEQGETIARFGHASLVRRPDGCHELLAGTAEDHSDARDGCSHFAPEVFQIVAPPSGSFHHHLCCFRFWNAKAGLTKIARHYGLALVRRY